MGEQVLFALAELRRNAAHLFVAIRLLLGSGDCRPRDRVARQSCRILFVLHAFTLTFGLLGISRQGIRTLGGA